jgi:hypothetical protein
VGNSTGVIALFSVLFALAFMFTALVITGPFSMKLTGWNRFFAGFGIFCVMNLACNFAVFVAVLGGC